ncbi:MAG: glycosyltransferase family 2 protein [Anditalea sp.]
MKFPLISAIITTFNRVDRLELALNSVVSQTYNNIEIIVVNDGDKSIFNNWWCNYLEKNNLNNFDVKFFHTDIKGANAARKLGLENSKGEYVAFLDDDDIWLPNKLKNQFNVIQSDSDVVLVTSNFIKINKHGDKLKEIWLSKKMTFNDLLFKNIIGGFSFPLIKKEILKEEYFPDDLESCQDWNLWLNVFFNNPDKIFLNTSSFEVLYLTENNNKNKISSSPIKKINGYSLVLELNKNLFYDDVYKWHVYNLSQMKNGYKKSSKVIFFVFIIFNLKVAKRWITYLWNRYKGYYLNSDKNPKLLLK